MVLVRREHRLLLVVHVLLDGRRRWRTLRVVELSVHEGLGRARRGGRGKLLGRVAEMRSTVRSCVVLHRGVLMLCQRRRRLRCSVGVGGRARVGRESLADGWLARRRLGRELLGLLGVRLLGRLVVRLGLRLRRRRREHLLLARRRLCWALREGEATSTGGGLTRAGRRRRRHRWCSVHRWRTLHERRLLLRWRWHGGRRGEVREWRCEFAGIRRVRRAGTSLQQSQWGYEHRHRQTPETWSIPISLDMLS